MSEALLVRISWLGEKVALEYLTLPSRAALDALRALPESRGLVLAEVASKVPACKDEFEAADVLRGLKRDFSPPR